MIGRRAIITLSAAGTLALTAAGQVAAQGGETRILVGTPAGGTFDSVSRLLAERMSDEMGEPVIVENRPGAAGMIALLELREADPDGRTLLVGTNSAFTIFPWTYDTLQYTAEEFQPVAGLAGFDIAVASGPGMPADGIDGFVEWARQQDGGIDFGSPGAGTTAHFAGILLGQQIGVPMNHIAYRGGAPAVADLMGGHIPLLVDAPTAIVEQYEAGNVDVLATTGDERTSVLPEVPTLLESDIDVLVEVAISVWGPAGMPDETVNDLNAMITDIVTEPEFAERLAAFGTAPDPATAEELVERRQREYETWEAPIAESGFRAN